MSDIRHSSICREALIILSDGPAFLMGHYFGTRRGQPMSQTKARHRRKVQKPLIHVDVAGQLTRAGVALIARTGRPDRPGSYMLYLSPFGRAMVTVMKGAPKPRGERRPDAGHASPAVAGEAS